MSLPSDPAACIAVAALHDAYEQALRNNDVTALQAFFWNDPEAVRYGVAEQAYGAAAIADYRQQASPPPPGRHVIRRSIVSFGPDHVSVMCEIATQPDGTAADIRQSQLWVRFPDTGWKIVAAHVSRPMPAGRPWALYAARTAASLGLPLRPEEVGDVAFHLERAATVAAPLLAHPVPETVERAAIFRA
jgi:ketosteroid isomerase-like protein